MEWVLYGDRNSIPFDEMELNGDVLSGMYNDTYQYLDLKTINDFDVMSPYVDMYSYIVSPKNNTNELDLLYNELKSMIKTCTPKHRIRFKGLGI